MTNSTRLTAPYAECDLNILVGGQTDRRTDNIVIAIRRGFINCGVTNKLPDVLQRHQRMLFLLIS